MKKLFTVLLVFVFVTVTGCSMLEDNYPSDDYEEYLETTAGAKEALFCSEVLNPVEYQAQAGNIAYTLEKNGTYKATFIYANDEGYVYEMPRIEWTQQYMNEKEYPELCKAGLTVMTLDSVVSMDLGSGRVVASMLEWERKNLNGSVVGSYALCDFNGDGKWDYLTGGEKKPWASFYGNGEEDCLKREIDEYNVIYFSSNDEIIELDDLSGTEKTSDFEKLLL